MEIQAVTKALSWVVQQDDTHNVAVTDSQSMFCKTQRGLLRLEWIQHLGQSSVTRLTWIHCPRHAGVRGNKVADNDARGQGSGAGGGNGMC